MAPCHRPKNGLWVSSVFSVEVLDFVLHDDECNVHTVKLTDKKTEI